MGGDTWWWIASAVNTDSMPPAPPRRCPVIDFVEFTAIFFAAVPNICLIALVSLRSPNGVDVPCALM